MIRVGIAGVGFMGMIHYLTWQKISGVEVVAICSRDAKKRAGDWTAIQGNFGPRGEKMDLSNIQTYDSIEAMNADESIDLIDVCLPPSLHRDATIGALESGKHVFCEKPLALTTADSDAITNAATQANRQLLVGHVLPYFPEYAWALREIRSGKHGNVTGGSFQRVVSDPAWLPNYWSADKVGGPLFDLHVHDAHFIRLLFGMPQGVVTHGSQHSPSGLPKHWHSLFQFKDSDVTVHATSGVIDQPNRPFLHGFEIQLERALLKFEFSVTGDDAAYACQPTLLTNDGEMETPDLGDGDPMLAFEAELQHVTNVLSGNAEPDALSSRYGRDAIEICHMQLESFAN